MTSYKYSLLIVGLLLGIVQCSTVKRKNRTSTKGPGDEMSAISGVLSAADLNIDDAKLLTCGADVQTFKVRVETQSGATFIKMNACKDEKTCFSQTFLGDSEPVDFGASQTLSVNLSACVDAAHSSTKAELCGAVFKIPDVHVSAASPALQDALEDLRVQETLMNNLCAQIEGVVAKRVKAAGASQDEVDKAARKFQERISTDACRSILLSQGMSELESQVLYEQGELQKKQAQNVPTQTVVVTQSKSLVDRAQGLVFLALGGLGVSLTLPMIVSNIRNYRASEVARMEGRVDEALSKVGFSKIQEAWWTKSHAEQLRWLLLGELVAEGKIQEDTLRQYTDLDVAIHDHPEWFNYDVSLAQMRQRYEEALEIRHRTLLFGEGPESIVHRPQVLNWAGDEVPPIEQVRARNENGIYAIYDEIKYSWGPVGTRYPAFEVEMKTIPPDLSPELHQVLMSAPSDFERMKLIDRDPRFQAHRSAFVFEERPARWLADNGRPEDFRKIQGVLDGIRELKGSPPPDPARIKRIVKDIKIVLREPSLNPRNPVGQIIFSDTLDRIRQDLINIRSGAMDMAENLAELQKRFGHLDHTNFKSINAYLDQSRVEVARIAQEHKLPLDKAGDPHNPYSLTEWDDWVAGKADQHTFERDYQAKTQELANLKREIGETSIATKSTEGIMQKALWSGLIISGVVAIVGASSAFGLAADDGKVKFLSDFNALYIQAQNIRTQYLASKEKVDSICKF